MKYSFSGILHHINIHMRNIFIIIFFIIYPRIYILLNLIFSPQSEKFRVKTKSKSKNATLWSDSYTVSQSAN